MLHRQFDRYDDLPIFKFSRIFRFRYSLSNYRDSISKETVVFLSSKANTREPVLNFDAPVNVRILSKLLRMYLIASVAPALNSVI